jgi:ribosomal peptide maturation radical SAM protein 1
LDLDLPEADCLLIVPPLAPLAFPGLGVHVLQACARQVGFDVGILYLNMLYGAAIGVREYTTLVQAPTVWLLGERLFARAAFGAPPLGFGTADFLARVEAHNAATTDAGAWRGGEESETTFSLEALRTWERQAHALVERAAEAIAEQGYAVVGASATFDQTAPSIAVLRHVKHLCPETKTIIGGANCEGEMADGLRSLTGEVDHVFSGESEEVFPRFLQDVRTGRDPSPPIIRGVPCQDLDALPSPRLDDYFAQLLPDIGQTPWISYETSRGCWWGQKHHCTFCGLDDAGMMCRQKSADRVVAELREIVAKAPTRQVCMSDNIMPWQYHDTLIPRLRAEVGDLHVFYEQKANLTLSRVKNLWAAGVRTIQPGIEALDSELLEMVRKGVHARQNVALLRYARCVGMVVKWNLLWGLPGDSSEPFERTLDLVPKLRHLCPPLSLTHVSIDRFSPYFLDPGSFGIRELAPLEAYGEVFPDHADLGRLAYHFHGAYPSGSREAMPLMKRLNQEIRAWQDAWRGDPRARPTLAVSRVSPGRFALVDTRGLGTAPTLYLNDIQAHAVLVGGPLDKVPAAGWAIGNACAVDLDGWCAPLAVANHALLREFEERGLGEARTVETVISR